MLCLLTDHFKCANEVLKTVDTFFFLLFFKHLFGPHTSTWLMLHNFETQNICSFLKI